MTSGRLEKNFVEECDPCDFLDGSEIFRSRIVLEKNVWETVVEISKENRKECNGVFLVAVVMLDALRAYNVARIQKYVLSR